MGLYPRHNLAECIAAAKANYPQDPGQQPHYTLVMSHRSRRRINEWENRRLRADHSTTIELCPAEMQKHMANRPQNMFIWVGLKLLACVKDSNKDTRIKNGMEYEVLAFTDSTVTLRQLHPATPDKNGEPFTLPHDVCALVMRLQHALCYYSTQGRTLRDGRVRLTQTSHMHFTKRHLIVGLSRTGHGQDVEIR